MNEWHDFLIQQGAQWQGERLIAFASPQQDEAPRTLIPMVEHQWLQAKGVDATKFLQGQCTCDVTEVEQNKLVLGAHCNRQGRMLSSFTLTMLPEQAIGLRLRCNIAQATLAAMQRYIVFSKATLTEADLVGLAVIGDLPNLPLPGIPSPGLFAMTDEALLLHHSSGLLEVWVEPAKAQAMWQRLAPHCQPAAPGVLDQHFIQNGIAEVQAPTQETYIPQHFNYQLINAINFKKGCYTGQEIVARLQYRSQLKKHCYRLTSADHSIELEVGTALYGADSPEKKTAEVVASAPGEVLAVCSEEVAAANAYLLGSDSQTKFTWAELPYAIT